MELTRLLLPLYILAALNMASSGAVAQSDDDDEPGTEVNMPEPAKPVVLEKIEVVGQADYCNPETLDQRLLRQYRDSRIVQRPQSTDCLLDDECNPNYLVAYIGATFIQLDKKLRRFNIVANGETCGENCSGAAFKKNKVTVIGPDHHYRESHEVSFDEMYDGFHKDIRVSCPLDTCKGVLYYTANGTMFYTEVKNASGKINRRLIVNGGKSAKFTTGTSDSIIPKCDP